jgi:tetrahydromethanopterin S-methyltransferase subunit G
MSKSKNSTSLYMIQSTYENGVHSSKIIEKLGTVEQLRRALNGKDPIEWAKEYIAEQTRLEQEAKRKILVKYSPCEQIPKNTQRLFNGGYLFLQKIYHELGLDKICRRISDKYQFDFDLNAVLSRLIYGRILYPASKLATHELSQTLLEPPNFALQHIYRGLEFLAKETDFIQSELYKNSAKTIPRKTGVLYYDCTNYFFEIEQEAGLKQYGYSKEHRPNPIVQMGLLMDGDGMPLAFCIHDGNTNEQITLKPIEQKILRDFALSKFVICTDAGLSSVANRKYNNVSERAFITTQSVKRLKRHLKDWALDVSGWRLPGDRKLYNLSSIDSNEYKDATFYKEQWICEDGLEQKLIVTYSIKYKNYQRSIRAGQIERAEKLIKTNPTKLKKANQNDYKRFIAKKSVTSGGEVADKEIYNINTTVIEQEEIFDGFYAVCTNLEDEPAVIIKINHRRWEIEECFRIMKSEFKARPVYLQRDDRIKAHFTTCFISLLLYRVLEKKLDEKFTCPQIIRGLREMCLLEIPYEGYLPVYTRTDFTDALHDVFGFRTDYQITTHSQLKNIFKQTKT